MTQVSKISDQSKVFGLPIPAGWRTAKLGDIAIINPRRPDLSKRSPQSPTTFVQMSSVSDHLGKIQTTETRPFAEVSKGYTFFGEGDVLFAKITPCMQNGKHAIATSLRDGIGFGSTEFHVLRPTDVVISEWLHFFVRQQTFLHEAEKQFTGSVGQQRVPESFLSETQIPLPSLAEQQRIIAQLNAKIAAIEQARTQSEEQSQELAALVTAGLRDSLAGVSKPFAAELVLDETSRGVGPRWREFPVIGATRAGWSPAKEPVGKQPERYKLVEPGMVFYNPMRIMIGSIAAVTRPDQIGITSPDYVVVRPKPEFLHPVWFYEWLRSPHHGGQFIAKLARGAVRERMLFTRLGKGIIPVPPLPAQEKFAALCVAARIAQEKITTLQTELEALPNALLRETFNGHF